ncbi:MAG: S41 family peptidase [Candidatus Saccharibacteria bacterium]|nr:S41 family peptidase [Candidatus Saccharibacteria bacterium]
MKHSWSARKINLSSTIIISTLTFAVGIFLGNFQWDQLIAQFGPYLGLKNYQSTVSLDWSSLNHLYSELSLNYDGNLDKNLLLEGAKKGLVSAVGDTYTTYMTKSEAADFQKSLHGDVGAGVGIEMSVRGGYVRVTRTLPENPARQAGILAGDIIYKVNDEEVWDKSADLVASKIRGNPGSTVKITIVRDKKELNYELVREKINNVSADVEFDQNTAIIRITRFDEDTGTKVQAFAKEFSHRNINKVILDLRNNGGGYVQAARDLLSLWIDGDKVFVQKSKTGINTTYAHRGQNLLRDTKTIVLVNNTTASASEMVAGALQDYHKATIIGEKTYGKGVVQTLVNLPEHALLKVTTAHWYTPHDTNINKTGITPDQSVEMTYDDINANRDPQLDAAKAF